ncbi:MrcB family domain-containing protein [Ureibacillus sp. NPDC094379]
MKEQSLLVIEIIESLKELGGYGTLNEIYDKVENRKKINLDKYTDWKAQIRRNIYSHSSDADIFRGSPGDSNDLFYVVQEKGNGVWGLKEKGVEMVQNNVSIKELINKILIEYLTEKKNQFSSNPIGQFVRHTIPAELKKVTFVNDEYKVTGSVGAGNWAAVPWIAIMNKRITTSTQRGYYLVYLFSEDMERVYLTFAQGVTETTKEEMEQIKKEIRSIVPKDTKFKTEPKIKLGPGNLARQYEDSVAVYIEYSKTHLPSDDELITDLHGMINLYEEFVEFKKPHIDITDEIKENDELPEENIMDLSSKQTVEHIYNYITKKGFFYSKDNINNLYLSLRSKPFVIISGISGTGKTKIVQLFAEAIGATEKNGQFKLIPVRPDWSDSSDLLGYRDIKGDFAKGPLTEIVEHALDNPELPHFVLLDEMNLARVEYYFSDVLSVMESRKKDGEGRFTSSPLLPSYDESLTLPGNLYVIGTVNMDETTHSFSKKVLDRANTIEFNEIDLMNFDSMMETKQVDPIRVSNAVLESTYIHLKDAFQTHEALIRSVSEKVNAINEYLVAIHAQVGYRVRDEISFYMAHNTDAGMLLTENEAMDFCMMQKILPRISGTESVVRPVLKNLEEELKQYPKCSAKITEMIARLDDHGFVSFWTA